MDIMCRGTLQALGLYKLFGTMGLLPLTSDLIELPLLYRKLVECTAW
jgi:hypothetical protein